MVCSTSPIVSTDPQKNPAASFVLKCGNKTTQNTQIKHSLGSQIYTKSFTKAFQMQTMPLCVVLSSLQWKEATNTSNLVSNAMDTSPNATA